MTRHEPREVVVICDRDLTPHVVEIHQHGDRDWTCSRRIDKEKLDMIGEGETREEAIRDCYPSWVVRDNTTLL